ncbi:winged helix-turn-helix transcriptional regulator [Patescibacteria group bacterium]|nr:winged helix-turn-helix transcriptional regulator [Patescibacteria group bacterium]
MLSKNEIKNSQRGITKISQEIEKNSNFYYLGSNPTRLKIMYLLKGYQTLCPTDFSQILNISISAISHQLSLLERSGLVKKLRMGRMICYAVVKQKSKFF